MKNRKKNSPDSLEEETKNPRRQRISVGSRRPNRLLRLTTVVLSVLGGAGAMENRKPVNDASGNSPAIPSDPPSSVDSFNLDPSFAFLSPDLKYWVDQEDEDDEDNDEDQDALSISNHEKALQAKSISPEILINTYLTGNQTEGTFAESPSGHRLYVWSGVGFDDTTGSGVYARLRRPDNTWGDQFLVNDVTLRDQHHPTVEIRSDDTALIAYSSMITNNYDDLYGRIYNLNMESLGNEFQIDSDTTDHLKDISFAVFSNDNSVGVWEEEDTNYGNIHAGMFQLDGTRIGNIQRYINSQSAGVQTNPRVTISNGGNHMIFVWEDQYSNGGIRSRTYQPNWTDVSGGEVDIADGTNTLHYPDAADLGNNRVVYVWSSDTTNGIHASVRDYATNIISSAQNVPIHEINTGNTPTHLSVLAIGEDRSGAKLFICSWEREGDLFARQMRLYQDQLYPIGHEFQMNEYTTGLQERPTMRFLNDGSFGFAWSGEGQGDPLGVFSREFNPIPEVINNQLTVIEGETVTLTSNDISITDFDNNPNEITITVSGVTNGQFESSANPDTPITSFTQDEVDNNFIFFIHDGSTNAPSYNLTATDGTYETTTSPGTIDFTLLTHSSTYTTSSSWWSTVRSTVISWFSSSSSSNAETSSQPPSSSPPPSTSSFESITSQLESSSKEKTSNSEKEKTSEPDNKGVSILWVIGAFLGGGVLCALAAGAAYFYKQRKEQSEDEPSSSLELGDSSASQATQYGQFPPAKQKEEEIGTPAEYANIFEVQRSVQN